MTSTERLPGRFRGRVVVVTGAARGVGRRAVELFVEEGARVAAVDRLWDELLAAFPDPDGEVEPVEAELQGVADCEAVIAQAVARFGRLDVLVNNAGVTLRAPIEETTDGIWDELLAINLRSAFVCCRAAIPHLRRQGGGAIVNNASINAIRGNVDLAAYSAAKGGLVALTRALATELAVDGIRVNAICPGTIDTPMTEEHLASVDDPAALHAALVGKHPLGRLATSDDVARALVFLASEDAAFITGVALPVDGGRHLV